MGNLIILFEETFLINSMNKIQHVRFVSIVSTVEKIVEKIFSWELYFCGNFLLWISLKRLQKSPELELRWLPIVLQFHAYIAQVMCACSKENIRVFQFL